ncbi:MAG: 3-oxoadipate enol-lactonase [Bryobacteraceae bacterium]
MPFVRVDRRRIYYRLEGRDGLPLVVFAHSLGVDHGQWDAQVRDLLPHFQVLRYDLRGHGASDAPPGDYTIADLAEDTLAMAGALGVGPFAFCGLSLGGMIGQWLGANAGERLTRLVLANTSPKLADPEPMEQRRRKALGEGMSAVADAVMSRFFMPETLTAGAPAVATIRRTLLATDPAGYAGCCAAVRDMDHRSLLGGIRAPTLVIGGERDVSTPWAGHGEALAAAIPGAQSILLPTAHLSNIEQPLAFSAALLRFLA